MKLILYISIAVTAFYTMPYAVQIWQKEKNKLAAAGIVALLLTAMAGALLVRIH